MSVSPLAIDNIRDLLFDSDVRREFFNGLDNPAWIGPLREAGYFNNPPTVRRIGKELVQFPSWPESRYLVRMADATPAEVAEIFASLHTENPTVIGDMVEAALAMPATVASLLVPAVCQAAVEGMLWRNHFKEASDLCVRLAEGGKPDIAIRLAETLFTPTFKEGEERLSQQDEYWYKRGLSKIIPSLATVRARVFVPRLCDWLKAALDAKKRVDVDSGRDYSYLWRPAIEEHAQNRDYDFAGVMVGFVREALELAIQNRHLSLPEGLGFIGRYPYLVFTRIQIHLIRLFAEQTPELARQYMLNRTYFDDMMFRHEYAALLRDRFGMLSSDGQQAILSWINDGPDRNEVQEQLEANLGNRFTLEKVDTYVKVWQRDRLNWFSNALPPEWRARYDAHVATLGAPDHADLSFWMDSSWEGGKPPKTAAELGTMSTDELVTYLRSWRPDPNTLFGPTIGDLMGVLDKAIENDLERFAVAAPAFADLHPTYVSGLLNRFMIAIQNGKTVTYDGLVAQCFAVVRKPVELAQEHRVGGDTLDSDPSWEYARNAVADLIQQMCDHDAPFAARKKLWECLGALQDAPDKDYIVGDPKEDRRTLVWLDRACNNPRAKVVHAIIRYAVWVKQCVMNAGGLKESDVGMTVIPEVQELLEKRLSPDCGDSPAVHSEYGTHFTPLCWVDATWAIDHAPAVFSLEGPRSAHGWAAWNSFLVANRAFNRVFRGIRSIYGRAIDTLTPDLAAQHSSFNPLASLSEHMMLLCGRGVVSLTDKDDLLKRLFRHVAPNVRGHAIQFVGQSLSGGEDLPPEVALRFVSMWEWYWAEFGVAHPEAPPEQFADFGWWLVCGRFDSRWCLDQLAAVAQRAPLIEPEHKILEKLSELSGLHPVVVINVADRMVRGDREGWRLQDWREHLLVVLKTALASGNMEADAKARGLIDHLGRGGWLEFGELLRNSDSYRDSWLPLYFVCNFCKWPEELKNRCELICRTVTEITGGGAKTLHCKGSYSFLDVRSHTKVLAKLALENSDPPMILIGFSASVGNAKSFAGEISQQVQNRTLMKQPFYMVVDPGGDVYIVADVLARFLLEVYRGF